MSIKRTYIVFLKTYIAGQLFCKNWLTAEDWEGWLFYWSSWDKTLKMVFCSKVTKFHLQGFIRTTQTNNKQAPSLSSQQSISFYIKLHFINAKHDHSRVTNINSKDYTKQFTIKKQASNLQFTNFLYRYSTV